MNIDLFASALLDKLIRRKEESRRSEQASEITAPWESWELDEKFFKALAQWTEENPETSLERFLNHISLELERSKDLFGLIPDTPFPARGLVTALAHLIKLGITISSAKRDVQKFVQDVVRWVEQVKGALKSAPGGRFTRSAWRDLGNMRDLIDEICLWATARLGDKKWLRIAHGLLIHKEIEEFRQRITDARRLFQDLSAINTARGLDAIMRDLWTLFSYQSIILSEIENVRKTQIQQLSYIIDELESQKQAAARDRFIAEMLAGHTVTNPTYDKQGKRPCDPGTRVHVLAVINQWIHDISPGTPNFLWLTGDPGCGKSAVTATIAKESKKQNILWAQFFINRNNAETTDPNSYFPSIATQLAHRSPDAAQAIHDSLVQNRTLTDGISAEQAAALFIDTVRFASVHDPERPVLVVIDGLDETDRNRLQDTAIIFSTLFAALETHSNVKVFISSRTEDEIRTSFNVPLQDKYMKRVHLDTSDPSSIADVSNYMLRNLMNIVKKHDLNFEVWPGTERSAALGRRASGLFIWGVTAVKFIQEQLQSDGVECLDEVLDMLTVEVLHDINALYALILKVAYGIKATDWDLERFRRVVGAIVFLQEPLCIEDLAALLDMRKAPSSNPVDIPHLVRRLRTILVIGTESINRATIPRIHRSVVEFITSESVDPRFRVNPESAHLELAIQCFAQLNSARASIDKNRLPTCLRYACRFWASHLSAAKAKASDILLTDSRAITRLLAGLSPYPGILTPAETHIRLKYIPAKSQIETLVGQEVGFWDALSGLNLQKHDDDVTCFAFSPDGKQIVSCSKDKTIRLWDAFSGRWIRTLVGYSSALLSIAFSPNGDYVVSGSSDSLLCLWDVLTGAPIGAPFHGHQGPVTCVAFSPDGNTLVSGSDDETCILWDLQRFRPIGTPLIGHEGSVSSIAFSPGGLLICSGDEYGRCITWDTRTGEQIRSDQFLGRVKSVSISPLGYVSTGNDVYETFIQPEEQTWMTPDTHGPVCIEFTPDGKNIIFGTRENISIIEFDANKHRTRVIKRGKYHGGDLVKSLAFSPNRDYFAWADRSVHVFMLSHGDRTLEVIPVEEFLPALQPKENDELMTILSNLQAVKRNHHTKFNNRRLDAVAWCGTEIAKEFADQDVDPRHWVIMDNIIIAGHTDGSVVIWRHGNNEPEESHV